jgi:hypothetical protein
MKNIYLLIIICIISFNTSFADEKPSIVTSSLSEYLNQKNNNELVRVNIRLKNQKNMLDQYARLKEMLLF